MKLIFTLWRKATLPVVILFLSGPVFSQTAVSSSSNSYAIPDSVWASYRSKALQLMEKTEPESFINYVVMMADGDMRDIPYFLSYVSKYSKEDFDEFIYRVGKGRIEDVEGAKKYMSSLQHFYTKYFKEFQKNRDNIVDGLVKSNPASGNNVNPSPQNCGSPCSNPGFESGNSFWDFWAGNPATAADPASLSSGFNPSTSGSHQNQHFITTAGGFDPTVGGNILPVVPPGGGSNSLQLGDQVAWGGNNGFFGNGSWGAARASISFTVSAANANFTYRYAIVLQDPNDNSHDPVNGFTKRPYFRVKLRDQNGNVVTCGDYEVVADGSLPDFTSTFTETSPGSDIWYREWTTVFVPLQPYIGQCITVEFTTSDCVPGGHFGYGYVDCSCEPLDIVTSSPGICNNNQVTLTAPAGGASYVWTDSAGTTNGFVGATDSSVAIINQPGTYKVVITSVAGPTCQTTLTITIGTGSGNPLANFTYTPTCAGAATHFTDSSPGAATGWKWDFDNDGIPDDTTQNPTHVFDSAGTYPVTLIITETGCSADTTIMITVNSGPQPTITSVGPYCASAPPVNLTASITGGIWSGTGITDVNSGTFTPSINVVGNDTITYSLGGTCPATAQTVITVNPIPIANAGPDVDICTNGTGLLGAASVSGYTYTWLPTNGLSSTTVSNPTITLTNTGNNTQANVYVLLVNDSVATCPAYDSVIVYVYGKPTANAGSSQTVCKGASITLAGSLGGSASSGSWSGGTGTYSPNNSALNAVYTPSQAEYDAGSVTLTLTTDDPVGPCNSSSSTVIFNFYENPVAKFFSNDPSGCPIHCVDFVDSSYVDSNGATISSWEWDFGDGTPVSDLQSPSHCFPQSGSYDVTLTVTSSQSCESSTTKTQFVHVFDVPVAGFSYLPDPATTLNTEISFNNESSSDVTYWHWDFGDSTTLSPSNSSPYHTYPPGVTGNYMVTLIVHNANNCFDTIAHPVVIGPEFSFFIPNAFSPNGDGKNDYFFGSGIGIIGYDMWIFDRWGNMIFHGKTLDSKWDGKANNGGQEAQIDVYVWKVKLTDIFNKEHTYMGTVTLVK